MRKGRVCVREKYNIKNRDKDRKNIDKEEIKKLREDTERERERER